MAKAALDFAGFAVWHLSVFAGLAVSVVALAGIAGIQLPARRVSADETGRRAAEEGAPVG